MFAPVDITISAYGSIFNHFQTIQPEISSQKQVNKSSFKKILKKSLPTYPIFCLCYANQTIFLGLKSMQVFNVNIRFS